MPLPQIRKFLSSLDRNAPHPLATLPNEIIICIIYMLPPSALASVVRVNRWFRCMTEPILYRNIDVRGHPRRTIKLYTTFMESPALASLVRSFDAEDYMPYPSRKIVRPSSWRGRGLYVEAMKRQQHLDHFKNIIFPLMVSNETIHFGLGSWSWLRNSSPHSLSNMPLRALVLSEFHWTFKDGLDVVIREHPKITRLELPYLFDDIGQIGRDDLPNLETFAGEPQAARHVVPGRPVKNLTLKSTSIDFLNSYDDTLRALARSTARITTLKIDVVALQHSDIDLGVTGGLLGSVARHHPHVVEFSLRGSVESSLWKSTLDHLLESIKTLHALKTLDFSGCYAELSGPFAFYRPDHSQCDVMLSEWSKTCPTLSKVVFPDECEWTLLNTAGGKEWKSGCANLRGPKIPADDGETTKFKTDLTKSKWWSYRRSGASW